MPDPKKTYDETIKPKGRILIIGDLNIDIIINNISIGANKSISSKRMIGGSGINSAIAFNSYNLNSVVFGSVGDDFYGKDILRKLSAMEIKSTIRINNNKPTCLCNILYFDEGDEYRTIFYDADNANDYNYDHLKEVINGLNLTYNDYVFITLYMFPQLSFDLLHCKKIFALIKEVKSNIVIDIVPHTLFNDITYKDLNRIIDFKAHTIIAEARTFSGFLGVDWNNHRIPTDDDYQLFAQKFSSKYLICRYGIANIEYQTILQIEKNKEIIFLERDIKTGYLTLPESEKRGFGDVLTAKILKHFFIQSI